MKWVAHFQRKTNSTAFIPQIDGLRFIAIGMVLLFHINIFVTEKVPFAFSTAPVESWWLFRFLDSDRKGVLLFFVISGFILAFPFAKAARQEGKPVELKRYYLKRLTRLEPPYFLVMIGCFFAILALPGHEFAAKLPRTFLGLLPNLGSSLIYMHNVIFPGGISVNPVAWSLEIEIQFYLLLPILVLVFKMPPAVRIGTVLSAILTFVFVQHIVHVEVETLFSYIQYFLIGFLLVDLYLVQFRARVHPLVSVGAGLLCLVLIGYMDLRNANALSEYVFIAAVIVLYALALTDKVWRKVFGLPFLTAIGGMCYSIYLIHTNVVAAVGNATIRLNISRSYPIAILWHTAILVPVVLFCSAIFYLLVERPCMDEAWPAKLRVFFTRKDDALVPLSE